MDEEQNVVGLTLAKINGMFHLDVLNARFSARRPIQEHTTGGGNKQALGIPKPSGSFDEVIPRQKKLNLRAMKNFTIDIYDQETRSIVIASFSGCNWENIDSSADNQSANARRSWGWKGTDVNEI